MVFIKMVEFVHKDMCSKIVYSSGSIHERCDFISLDNMEVAVCETTDAQSLKALLTEMNAEDCAHSWRKLPIDTSPQDLSKWENRRRPTTIHYYYLRRVKSENSILIGAASIAHSISHQFCSQEFPVLARCYVRPPFRGLGLYRLILCHRLSFLMQGNSKRLKAIHMGTANSRVERNIIDNTLPWNGFLKVGWEDLLLGSESVRVGGYLLFSPSYKRDILAEASKLKFPANGLLALDFFECLFSGHWHGPGDAYSQIVDFASANEFASKKEGFSPIWEMVRFCANIPFVYSPEIERNF